MAEKEACLVGYLLTTRSGSESAGPGKRRPGQIGVKAGRVGRPHCLSGSPVQNTSHFMVDPGEILVTTRLSRALPEKDGDKLPAFA